LEIRTERTAEVDRDRRDRGLGLDPGVSHLCSDSDMKPLDHYRIVDIMGLFYPQQEYIGLRGRRKWKHILTYHCTRDGGSWIKIETGTSKDAELWLAEHIAEANLYMELKKRGPVVVKEIVVTSACV
jgi:hypothetical protein